MGFLCCFVFCNLLTIFKKEAEVTPYIKGSYMDTKWKSVLAHWH